MISLILVKIINILQILQGVCKLLTSTVSLDIKVSDSDLKSAAVAQRQYDIWTLYYIPNKPDQHLIFSAVASVWLYLMSIQWSFWQLSMLYLQPYSHKASVCVWECVCVCVCVRERERERERGRRIHHWMESSRITERQLILSQTGQEGKHREICIISGGKACRDGSVCVYGYCQVAR